MATILFLHGWQSVVGGVKPTYLIGRGHRVLNPALPDDDFDASMAIAEAQLRVSQIDAIVGSSRGGAVAINMESGEIPLILLCPAWRKYGRARSTKASTTILHSSDDDVIPIEDSRALLHLSGLPDSRLVVVGRDHRLADPEPLAAMAQAIERALGSNT